MILRIATFLLVVTLGRLSTAEIAPEITILEEGYNVIAKIPCLKCPFLFQDTSKGQDGGWAQREDNNALVNLPSYQADMKNL
jgi:hypothetical protein